MLGADHARLAKVADAERITAIYNQGIEDRVGTFETEPRTVEAVRGWFSQPYPIVVVERSGDIVAWANTSQYRSRPCYAGICEFSVYVDRAARGTGAGKLALQTLFEVARARGYTKLVSRVFVENTASRQLLASLGFREVGVYHRHGQLDGQWRDVLIVERLLGAEHELWDALDIGRRITVVKVNWREAGNPVIYPATVMDSDHAGWVAVEAEWAFDDRDVAGVQFERGARIVEYFAPNALYNIFQVFRRNGEFSGIYANVTAPVRLELDHHGKLILIWEDHWLDVVKSSGQEVTALDYDEFIDSGVERTHPELAVKIIAAAQELRSQIESGRWDP